LETAELRVKDRKDITLSFWRDNVNRILELNDKDVLTHSGSITYKQVEEKVNQKYDDFHQKQIEDEAKQADFEDLTYLENQVKKHKK